MNRPSQPTALVMDWGGVLTDDVSSIMVRSSGHTGIPIEAVGRVMRSWYFGPPADNPVFALERGELTLSQFEDRLGDQLTTDLGHSVSMTGVVQAALGQIGESREMVALVRRARDIGIRTALLSNSWGNQYPDYLYDDMFDVMVISGEVGMRKPDSGIFLHTTELLAEVPQSCVFVDDSTTNVDAARKLGFTGIHHTQFQLTAEQLSSVFATNLHH